MGSGPGPLVLPNLAPQFSQWGGCLGAKLGVSRPGAFETGPTRLGGRGTPPCFEGSRPGGSRPIGNIGFWRLGSTPPPPRFRGEAGSSPQNPIFPMGRLPRASKFGNSGPPGPLEDPDSTPPPPRIQGGLDSGLQRTLPPPSDWRVPGVLGPPIPVVMGGNGGGTPPVVPNGAAASGIRGTPPCFLP